VAADVPGVDADAVRSRVDGLERQRVVEVDVGDDRDLIGIGDSTTIRSSARTSSSRGTAQRTRSPPASAMAWICFIVASKSAVSVFVID
jgi:hypothetical protein